MVKTAIAFVDGENLVCRYQEMAATRKRRSEVSHFQDAVVWSPQITLWTYMDLIRVNYYTSVVGTDEKVRAIEQEIASITYSCRVSDAGLAGSAKLIPRVHKRLANSRKSKVVDVDITLDVMRTALETQVGAIFLLSGDGDYLPLVREVARRTAKQVWLGAFSSGLSEPLRDNVEAFVQLDSMFFE
jgi:uncharacterized LabA/DUF88 family protein